MQKEFNKNFVDKGKFINTRIKCFNGKVIKDFKQREKAPKMGSFRICLPEIVLDCVLRMKNNDAHYKYSEKIVNKMLDKQVFVVSRTTNTIKFIFCTTKHKRDITRLSEKMITTLFQGTQSLKDVWGS